MINTHHFQQPTNRNKSYSPNELVDQVIDDATPTQPNYTAHEPTYNMITTNNEGLDTYAVIGHTHQKTNTPQAASANSTQGREEESKKEDDFYNAEQHTYSVVNVKHKKKTNKQTSEDDMCEGEGDEN